jgi:hypothetical protein
MEVRLVLSQQYQTLHYYQSEMHGKFKAISAILWMSS